MTYLWIKAFHVIAVIAWMAAQLYLPRLFVYHATAVPRGELSETLKLMESRLLRWIMTPALVATLVFGFAMTWLNPSLWSHGWFHVKLFAVLILLGVHGLSAKAVRQFAADQNQRSARFYRILNEVPTLALSVAVIAVIVRRLW